MYENALVIELMKQGLSVEKQHSLVVSYKDIVVGEFVVDLLVEGKVILELKAVSKLQPVHEAQLLNYLKVANIKVGLLVNFTYPKAVVKRVIL